MTAANRPWDLRVEHLDEPFGIDVVRPRVSWKLPVAATRQVAYRVIAGAWDSGRVESDQSVLVEYDGPPLTSRARVEWRVQVWTDLGPSEWSDPVTCELGLLGADEWSARWIAPVGTGEEAGLRGAPLLRRRFTLADRGAVARVYATAHGVYELFLNGVRVGDQELTPGFTSYRSRLQVQTYDVGPLLRDGENELLAVVSDGWWRGFVAFTREHDVFGTELGLLAQLEVDGRAVVVTDGSWETTSGPIVAADLIEGQHTDLRVMVTDATWEPVREIDADLTNLCAPIAPPVRGVELVRPKSVSELGDLRVVDLGQNINGWVRLRTQIPDGATISLTHGEALDADGDVTMEHLRPIHWKTQEPMSAGQVDRITGAGDVANVEARHATKGFRYVRIEGLDSPLTSDDLEGVVVHTDLRRTGWFTCSDPRLDRLHAAADWSFRTNACDIPTDCPQRERAGWTGDWQIFAPTAAFLYDVAGFTTKWLRDLAADQRADGCVRNFAPDPAYEGSDDHPFKTFLEGSSGWGDAAVLVPWTMYRCYADDRLLHEQWPSMQAWVEFAARAARSGRHASRTARSDTPAPHEQYVWDTGFHWGEWCEPGLEDDHFSNLGRDFGIVATAYLARSAATLAKVATVIGRESDAERYRELAELVADAWCAEFLDDEGDVRSDRQADHVRALAFDLVPSSARTQVARRLVELIRAKDTHLDTGFLATPMLLPVLADSGHLDVAYDLLMQDTAPSWLTMIDRGATTIWEHWDGVDADGRPKASLNHYSKGAVISFLHEYTAGLQIVEPAYRRFRVAPRPGAGITSASAAHESPFGRIESAWTLDRGDLRLTVRVPPGTHAEVELPGAPARVVGPGTTVFVGGAEG